MVNFDLIPCPFCSYGRIKHTESDDPQFYFECTNENCVSLVVHAESEEEAFNKIKNRRTI